MRAALRWRRGRVGREGEIVMVKRGRHRVLFIEPPFYRLFKNTYSLHRYPLSLGYLAGTVMKETDWGVMAYNADFYPQSEVVRVRHMTGAGFDDYLRGLRDPSRPVWKEVRSCIEQYQPTVVGISAKSQTFVSACMVAKLAKEVDQRIVVIVGGPHPSMVGAEVLECADIDAAVRGEGERTVVELLDAVDSRRGFDGVDGVVFRDGDRIVENAPRQLIDDVDSLCFPHESAREVLRDRDEYPLRAFSSIFAIRGCPYECLFCGSREIWSRKVRYRSPGSVVREIKGLQKMGLRSVRFDDDTFGVNRAYIADLCGALSKHCPGLKWSCELHVKLVDDETVSLMKSAGCYLVEVGIESGNNKILAAMRKNITIEEALAACRLVKKHGLQLLAFFMVGFPQETEDTLRDTISAMRKTRCDAVSYSIFTPYPGTEIFGMCREQGLIGDDFDVSLYNHKSPANCFCANITPERFRTLVGRIEKSVDRRNLRHRVRRALSLDTVRRAHELGVRESLQRGVRGLIGTRCLPTC
jgi:tRNA A37 methylthiotransferase MiaB